MKCHVLKLVHPFFDMSWNGEKTYEFRKADRDYNVGDCLTLREYFPDSNEYGDRIITGTVAGIVDHSMFETVPDGWVIMQLKDIVRTSEEE